MIPDAIRNPRPLKVGDVVCFAQCREADSVWAKEAADVGDVCGSSESLYVRWRRDGEETAIYDDGHIVQSRREWCILRRAVLLQEEPVASQSARRLTLYLVRGLPGEGKTTYARELAEAFDLDHFEADMLPGLYVDGELQRALLPAAHAACQRKTREALAEGRSVVVANTFVRRAEMAPYVNLARDFGARVVISRFESSGSLEDFADRNAHGAGLDVVTRMADNWEGI